MRNEKILKIFLKKNKFISILLIIELAIATLLIYNIQKEIKVFGYMNKLDSYSWNEKGTYKISLAPNSFFSENENLNKFYKELKKSKIIKNIGLIYPTQVTVDGLKVNYLEKIHMPYSVNGAIVEDFGDEFKELVPIRVMDYGYYKELGINIKKGRALNYKDSNKIILGEKFENYVELQDKFKLQMGLGGDEKFYEVAGISKGDTPLYFDRLYYDIVPFLDDSMIVILKEEDFYKDNMLGALASLGGINVKFIHGDYDKYQSDIIKLAKKHNLDISINSNLGEYEKAKDKILGSVKYSLMRTSILLLLILLGGAGSIMYSLYQLKKELGIIISLGAKKKDIILVVLIKTLIIAFIAFIIGIYLNKYINLAGGGWFTIQSTKINTIITGVILLIIIFLITLIPIKSIIKIKAVNLIGGEK
ncbi:FtsX-like permease family protein [Eubacterium multiforme]|uniref:ABC transport system permease protein n=1 Tax=Eubacterium multiforme TaxID=83339 RepID=A0ABT9UXL4_9FIRM|nr:FtsX-like permease family protein [Eubacterium multiforme]MDQ0151051.1 putative ABC transport system permease protein [Eubacterium multiforme]